MKMGSKKTLLSSFHKSKKGKTWISSPNGKYTRFNYFLAHDFSTNICKYTECNLASREQLAVVDYFVTKMFSLCGKTPLFSVQSNVELYYACKSKSFRFSFESYFSGKKLETNFIQYEIKKWFERKFYNFFKQMH